MKKTYNNLERKTCRIESREIIKNVFSIFNIECVSFILLCSTLSRDVFVCNKERKATFFSKTGQHFVQYFATTGPNSMEEQMK